LSVLNFIVEFEGPVANVRPRYWSAHKEAIQSVGCEGPSEDEFWRLVRKGAPDAEIVRFGGLSKIQAYTAMRDEQIDSTDLMRLDELQPGTDQALRSLKQRGTAHLVTCCQNRPGINATLDRLDIWIHFDQKQALPENRERRVGTLSELTGEVGLTLAVVGTVPMAYAAGEAGCRLVGVNNGPTTPNRLRQVGVDVLFDSIDELTDALDRRDPQLQRAGLF